MVSSQVSAVLRKSERQHLIWASSKEFGFCVRARATSGGCLIGPRAPMIKAIASIHRAVRPHRKHPVLDQGVAAGLHGHLYCFNKTWGCDGKSLHLKRGVAPTFVSGEGT